MTASRLVGVLIAVAWTLPAHAMSGATATSAGSFFAAAAQCEAKNLITPGQTEELMQALEPYLSKSDKASMAAGNARGTRDSQVFIDTTRQWIAFTPDETSCYRVQGVLDDYKAQVE